MANHPYAELYVPLLLLAATPFAAFGLPALATWISPAVSLILAAILFVSSGVLAYRAIRAKTMRGQGGQGGNATSLGEDNEASGGNGGAANGGTGGNGGNATVRGKRSVAKGGQGGAG